MTDLEILTSIISNLGHDVAHPGYTNRYLINSRNDLAISYNDNSVLESMHCAKVFQIMKSDDCNILKSLEAEL